MSRPSRSILVAAVAVAVTAVAHVPATADPLDDATTPLGNLVDDNPWIAPTDDGFLHIAHRGGGAEVPEHTLFAYEESLKKGVEMLEADIYLTLDDHLVVLHDATVNRTTEGTGAVSSKTLAELKALDNAYDFCPPGASCVADADYPYRGVAHGTKPAPAGYEANDFRIMTLDEALTAFPDIPFTIELKPNPEDTGRFERFLADVLESHDRTDDVIVASFIDTHLEVFKAYAPQVHTSFPTGQAASFSATSFEALPGSPARHFALQVPTTFGVPVTSADYVADAHANGIAVQVWTINDCPTMVQLLEIGVDGIMTDRPTRLQAVLDAWNTAGAVDCATIV